MTLSDSWRDILSREGLQGSVEEMYNQVLVKTTIATDHNMQLVGNVEGISIAREFTELKRTVSGLVEANQNIDTMLTHLKQANQSMDTMLTHLKQNDGVRASQLRDLQSDIRPIQETHYMNRLSVIFAWAGVRHDTLRISRNAAIHGGDILSDVRVIDPYLQANDRDSQKIRLGWIRHYGIEMGVARSKIPTAPAEIVETSNVLASIRDLNNWQEPLEEERKRTIENLGESILQNWLDNGSWDRQEFDILR